MGSSNSNYTGSVRFKNKPAGDDRAQQHRYTPSPWYPRGLIVVASALSMRQVLVYRSDSPCAKEREWRKGLMGCQTGKEALSTGKGGTTPADSVWHTHTVAIHPAGAADRPNPATLGELFNFYYKFRSIKKRHGNDPVSYTHLRAHET